jgi:tetratricopeptide (TPR) repeat protein
MCYGIRPADSEPLFSEALAIARRKLPPDDPQVAAYANNLAMCLEYEGKFAAAEPIFRDTVAVNRRTSTTRPLDREVTLNLVASLINLGGTLNDEGKPAEAAVPLQEAMVVARRGGVPPEHPYLANGAGILADVEKKEGNLAEAERWAREAVRINDTVLPPGHPAALKSLKDLADILSSRGKFAEAERIFRDVLDADRRAGPANATNADDTTFDLGDVLLQGHRPADAEPLFREALNHALDNLPAEARIAAKSTDRLATLLQQDGRNADCESVLAKSLLRFRQSLPAGHPAIIFVLLSLNEVRLKSGHAVEAETGFREADTLIRRNGTMGTAFLARADSGLGRSLLAEAKPAEALPLLQKALDEFIQLDGPASPDLPFKGAEPLATALEQLGRHDEAKALRAKYPMPTPATKPTSRELP